MNTGAISMRYARALFAFAKEQKCEDGVYAEMKQLLTSFREVKGLRMALSNPTLPAREKAKVLCDAAGIEVSVAFERYALLSVAKQRESMAPFVAHCYLELYREEKKVLAVKLTTAVPLSDEVKSGLRSRLMNLTHSAVELTDRVDPAIMGGFIFQLNSNRLDASVRNQLERVKKQFIERNRRII